MSNKEKRFFTDEEIKIITKDLDKSNKIDVFNILKKLLIYKSVTKKDITEIKRNIKNKLKDPYLPRLLTEEEISIYDVILKSLKVSSKLLGLGIKTFVIPLFPLIIILPRHSFKITFKNIKDISSIPIRLFIGVCIYSFFFVIMSFFYFFIL